MKIGLIGEDPNDTHSIANLLKSRYESYQFIPLLKGIRGDKLNSAKFPKMLNIEAHKINACRLVVCIKDLDGLSSEHEKVKSIQEWHHKVKEVIEPITLLLLNIYELEALLLADTESLSDFLNCTITFRGNPEKQINPKEYIRHQANKQGKEFLVSDCPAAFQTLRIEQVYVKCASFKSFIDDFNDILGK